MSDSEDPVSQEHHEQDGDDLLLFHLPTLWYPVFDIAHFACAALQLRAEYGQSFARQHPVASCIAMVASSFAGSFLTSFALGLPAVSPLQREDKVLLAVLVWLAVFYSPRDFGHRLLKNRMVFLLFSGMKEIYRVRKIVRGISLALNHYPSSILIPVIIGVLKGNGSGFLRPLTRLICGVWRPEQTELLVPSLTTRYCVGASIVWISGKLLLDQPQLDKLLYNSLVVIFVSIKLLQSTDISWPKLLTYLWRKNAEDEAAKEGVKEDKMNTNDKVEGVQQIRKEYQSHLIRNDNEMKKRD